MNSISFPTMFTTTKTLLHNEHDATATNLLLLLCSNKEELFGDPYFGTKIRKYIYEQNNYILRDILIDDIYMAIYTFMPQIEVSRNDIKIISDKMDIWAEIKCKNLVNSEWNIYSIKLTDENT